MARAVKRECRSCAFFGVRVGERARVGNVYPCLFEVKMPALPASVSNRYQRELDQILQPSHVEPTDGTTCPTYEWKP